MQERELGNSISVHTARYFNVALNRTEKNQFEIFFLKYKPGWAPNSITCNFEVICPALVVFEAKQIRVDGFSLPTT